MSEHVIEIEMAQFDELVVNSTLPVVLDFYSTECPPCEALAPKYEAVAEAYAGRVRFYKMFRQGNRELALKLGVTGSPTLLFFAPGGRELEERLNGEIQKSQLKRMVETLLAG